MACPPTYPRLCVEFRVDVVPQVGWVSKRAGRGALSLLRRTVPLQLCKLAGRERSETRMRSRMVIIQPRGLYDLPCFGQTVEQVFVEAFVAQAAVEALDESVLDRLARLNIQGFDLQALEPFTNELL